MADLVSSGELLVGGGEILLGAVTVFFACLRKRPFVSASLVDELRAEIAQLRARMADMQAELLALRSELRSKLIVLEWYQDEYRKLKDARLGGAGAG